MWKAEHFGLDLVVSNPPYISEQEYRTLDSTVREFEPKSALVPDPSGLEHLRVVVLAAARLLRPGGLLLMEHGAGQGQSTRNLCNPEIWGHVSTGLDLAGHERFLIAEHR
jgi:release factor glutamine methyltransferase